MNLFKKYWQKALVCAALFGGALTSVFAADALFSAETTNADLKTDAVSLSPGYLECDGTRYMTIPHSSDFDIAAGGSMTVSAKVWLDSYGAHRGIVANRWHAGTSNGSTTGFEIYGGNSATQSMSNNVNLNKGSWNNIGHVWCNTLGTGKWTVVTWVLDGAAGTSKMYLDGVLKHTVNPDIANYAINPQADILVGARYNVPDGAASTINTGSCWLGKIDDVRIYSRALSADEVVADMTATVGPETEGLIAAYDFSELTGTNAPDISGHGHDGVLVNFPDYSATGSVLTIEAPEEGTGTISVTDGTKVYNNGSRVEDGTVLTVNATPATDYVLESITVNGSVITGNTFTMDGATTVGATFVRDASAPTKVLVFDMDEDGSKYYRIPALVTAADGSLVALADKRGDALGDLPNTISVVAKRSTDGGETWSEAVTIAQGDKAAGKTYGDPAVVLDRNTGNLVAVFSGDTGFFISTPTNRAGIYVSKSSDNGVTWSEPKAITSQVYQSNWYGAFCASGSMLQTKDGRIMFVANTRTSSAQYVKDVYEFVCCSEDGGDTWTVLNPSARIPAAGNGNESKLVETSDGTLIMSIRSAGSRRFAKSTDGGVTWTAAQTKSDLIEPDCNGDIIVYPSTDGQTRMLHSLPANASTRRNVSVYMSYDEGETWPVKRQLLDTYSAYSSLAVLPDGSIGCFVEEGKWDSNIPGTDGFRLYFMKFTLDWLTDGADNGDTGGDNSDVYDGTLNLDGTRYMIIPNSEEFNIPAGGTMTVSVKAKIANHDTQTFVTNRVRNYEGNNNNDVSGWALRNVSNTTTTSFNYPGSSWVAKHHDVTPGISTDEWHHLCWVYTGTTSTFYIDGQQAKTATGISSSSAIPSYCDILVGAGYVMQDNVKFSIDRLNDFVVGNIDDVRIYRSALSATEVAEDKNATAPLAGKEVIAAYDFSEIKGLNVTDISGNGHTGLLVNFPENAPGYTLHITTPNEDHGTLEVFNGETSILNGRKVDGGTELRVVATPRTDYLLKAITVNDVELEVTDNTATFVMNEESTVAAVFERDPSVPVDYCIPKGTATISARNITTITLSDELSNQGVINGNTGGDGGYLDKTAQMFTTSAGQTVTVKIKGNGEWMHEYLFIDYGNDGVFDVDNTQLKANNDLVSFTTYAGVGASDDGPWYNSHGTRLTGQNPHRVDLKDNTMPTFTLPANLAPGTYRARFTVAWNCVDPCLSLTDPNTNEKGRACIDFTIVIESDELEAPRDITIKANADALGTVAFVSPESTETTISTAQKNVLVRATAAENCAFINWTNAAGEVVSTEADYTYTGEEAAELTANFGGMLSWTASEGGLVSVTVNGTVVNNNTVIAPGDEVTFTVTPEGSRVVRVFTVNGEACELTDGVYTFTAEGPAVAVIEFQDMTYTLNSFNVSGNGTAVFYAGGHGEEDQVINVGDGVTNATDYHVLCYPGGNDEGTESFTIVVVNGDNTSEGVGEDGGFGDSWWDVDNNDVDCFVVPIVCEGNMEITVTFTTQFAAIGDLIFGDEEGVAEYFTLQGVKVSADNLTSGIYIVRKGSKTAKIYIRK